VNWKSGDLPVGVFLEDDGKVFKPNGLEAFFIFIKYFF
jgi:hypothetical protein